MCLDETCIDRPIGIQSPYVIPDVNINYYPDDRVYHYPNHDKFVRFSSAIGAVNVERPAAYDPRLNQSGGLAQNPSLGDIEIQIDFGVYYVQRNHFKLYTLTLNRLQQSQNNIDESFYFRESIQVLQNANYRDSLVS